MYHHHILLTLADARTADLRAAAQPRKSTASSRPRYRLRALALGLAVIAGVAPAAALARPAHDLATPANESAHALDRDHTSSAAPSITFTNPLGRSRGPGAGAGLL
jgi:hypothetical protein